MFISNCRVRIDTLLSNLINNITRANSIYSTSVEEYYWRRGYQDKSIGDVKFSEDDVSNCIGI